MKTLSKFLLLFTLALTLNAASWQKIASTPTAPTNGLVAYYQCENNVLDTQGTYNGTASNVTYGAGKSGVGCVGNGTNTYISTNFSDQDAFSVAMWVNSSSFTGAPYVFGLRKDASVTGSSIQLTTSNGCLAFGGTSNGIGWAFANVVSSTPVVIGSWYHIAVVFSANSIMFYVNGSYAGMVSGTRVIDSNNKLWFFTDGADRSYHFTGSIDQVRIYNRGVSAGEIQSIYQAGN